MSIHHGFLGLFFSIGDRITCKPIMAPKRLNTGTYMKVYIAKYIPFPRKLLWLFFDPLVVYIQKSKMTYWNLTKIKTSITHLLHGILLESLLCPDMWLESWLDYNTAKMFISDSYYRSPNIVFMQLKQVKKHLHLHFRCALLGVEVKWQ